MIWRWLILLCLLVSLQACGFQLRGFASLPERLNSLQLEVDSLTSSQKQSLTQKLQRAGALLHHDDSTDVVRLLVSIESLPERNLVNSRGAGERIVRLSRQLTYSLIDASGSRLVDNKTLVETRDLEFDESNLLGTKGEKLSALESLDSALFNSLMIQLQRF